ncbi:hypothetical protein V6Z77_010191 [Aspergillus fumigatus]
MGARASGDHPIQNGPPASQIRTLERLHARSWPGRGRWFYVEGESRVTSWWRASSAPATSSCQAGRLSVTGGAQVPQLGLALGTGSRPSQPWFLLSSGRRRSVPGRVVQAVDGVRSVQQWARQCRRDMRRAPVRERFGLSLKNAREPTSLDDRTRGPLAPAPMDSSIVGRWPS